MVVVQTGVVVFNCHMVDGDILLNILLNNGCSRASGTEAAESICMFWKVPYLFFMCFLIMW